MEAVERLLKMYEVGINSAVPFSLLFNDLPDGEGVRNAAFPFSETSLFLADDVLSCS